MSAFSEAELAFLTGARRLARVATVGKDGTRQRPRLPSPVSIVARRDTRLTDVG